MIRLPRCTYWFPAIMADTSTWKAMPAILMPSASCGLQCLSQNTVASVGIAPRTAAYSVG